MKTIDNSLYPGGDPNYKFRMMKQQWFANGQSGLYNDDIKWLFAEVERLSKENEKLSNEQSMSVDYLQELKDSAFYWQNLHDKTVTELQVKLDDANELLNQRYVDDKGTVWTIPTPEAYASVCKRMHGLKMSNELLKVRLRDYKGWIQRHRNERKLKWNDVQDTMPKDDELIVLLMDNGRVDTGHKSNKGCYWVSHGFMLTENVTHWMPIPKISNE